MAFTRTWNPAYEASPDGGDLGSTLDNRMREFKQDVRERIAADHYMDTSGTDADHGQHLQVTLRVGAYSGSGTADKAIIHAVDDTNSKARPCYTDEDGNADLRLVALEVATEMAFFQASAPVGWTQNTTNTDAFLRVVSDGTGGTTGGSVSAATLAHTHTMGTHTHTMGTHNHKVMDYVNSVSSSQVYNNSGTLNTVTPITMASGYGIALANASVSLGEDMYSENVDPGDTAAANAGESNNRNITPKYINMIVCALD